MKKATLIYNPIAGRHPARRERQVREATAALRAAGMEVDLARTAEPATAQAMARAAVEEGRELILVCGGDGTINEVVNGLIPGSAAVGILPGGTANVMARELGLPRDPVRAARELPMWSPRRIAVGQVTWAAPTADSPHFASAAAPLERAQPGRHGGPLPAVERRYFLSVAGIGFDAYVVHKLASGFKMSLGVVAYGLEALRQVRRYSFPLFTCQANGREFRATLAVVHRTSRYAGWLRLAPEANIFQPRFSVCLFKSTAWLRYLLYAGAALTRQHARLSDVERVEVVDATKIVCSAPGFAKPVYVELDGELAAQLPVTFEIVPDALTLLVPK